MVNYREKAGGDCTEMKIIALDGVDAAGKTTQAARLVDVLRTDFFCQYDVWYNKEAWDEFHYLAKVKGTTPPMTGCYEGNLFWFAAIRADMLNRALSSGAKVAVFDRYVLSSVVYANAVGAVDIDLWLNRIETDEVTPRPIVNFIFTESVGSGNGGCFEQDGIQSVVKDLFLHAEDFVDWPTVFIEKGDVMAQEEQIRKWLMNAEL